MKNKMKKLFSELNFFVSSEKFLLIFLFIIINNIYGAMALIFAWDSYIDSLFSIFTGSYYLLILQLCIFISVNTTISQFEKNSALIIRFKNHREYCKELFKRVLRNTLFVFIVNLIVALLILNLIRFYNIGIGTMEGYNISNVLYLIFYMIRTCIIILLNALVFLYIMKNTNKNIGIVLCLLYLVVNIFSLREPIYIFYSEYFKILICGTFIEEVIRSVIFIGVFGVFLKIFHEYTTKHMKKLVD